MKRSFILIAALFAFAFSADISKFTGPEYKTATVKVLTQVKASVDAKTSETGKTLAWLQPGKVAKVLGVYSPFVELNKKGWAWVELLSVDGDKAKCDKNTDGRLGVALLAEPNKYDVVNGALFADETATITGFWIQWVKIEVDGVVGLIHIDHIELK